MPGLLLDHAEPEVLVGHEVQPVASEIIAGMVTDLVADSRDGSSRRVVRHLGGGTDCREGTLFSWTPAEGSSARGVVGTR